jgi:hypothetical protein
MAYSHPFGSARRAASDFNRCRFQNSRELESLTSIETAERLALAPVGG